MTRHHLKCGTSAVGWSRITTQPSGRPPWGGWTRGYGSPGSCCRWSSAGAVAPIPPPCAREFAGGPARCRLYSPNRGTMPFSSHALRPPEERELLLREGFGGGNAWRFALESSRTPDLPVLVSARELV